jgi:hypothetical protein
MKKYILLILPLLALSCRFSSIGDVKGKVDYVIPDIINNKLNKLLFIKRQNITDELNIRSIEKGVDSLEIRLWTMAATAKGGEVYIIRKSKYKWNCYHYWFIERLSTTGNTNKQMYTFKELSTAGLDTFWIKKEGPRSGWNRFISKLNESEFYNLESFDDVSIEVAEKIDTYSFMIEYAVKNKYRLFWYNCSDIYTNCQRCQEMIGVLRMFDDEFNFNNSLLGNYRCRR